MEKIINYVEPELLGMSAALYFVGRALKNTQMLQDRYIPLTLGGIGIALCTIWVLATGIFITWQDVAMGIFNAITQGILAAGLSTYVNQVFKQLRKT